MNKITIQDKHFELFLTHEKIFEAVRQIAEKMNSELAGKDVIFLGVLNGAFIFASDLLKLISFQCRISFLKLVSFQGTSSTGAVTRLIGLNEDITGKIVVVLEDIVDSGLTMDNTMQLLKELEPAEIRVAALLLKSANYRQKVIVDYIGFEIPNDFIVGYGLDYNGYGRNLINIYKLIV
jgi:hypoxanthine phosphoribosyltransferase